MRNQYGIWTQQRWLRSFRTSFFEDKPTPAPLEHQPYYERVKQLGRQATQYYGGRAPSAEESRTNEESTKLGKGKKEKPKESLSPSVAPTPAVAGRPEIRWVKDTALNQRHFDKNSYSEWRAVVENEDDFLSIIPRDDPYRLERDLNVYASGDFRYFAVSSSEKNLDGKDQRTWLMGSDIGVRLRPTRYNQLSAVVEARFQNPPQNEDPEDGFTSGATTKSAYILADDLPYNSFIQAGLYRPMFGLHDPDHTTLSSEISGLTQNATFKSFGVGTAPNVPFLVFNYLQPYRKTGTEYQASEGMVATAGARFVTYGLSLTGSYWDTQYVGTGSSITNKRNMYAFTAGGTWMNLIANLEILRAEASTSNGVKNAGGVTTLHLKYRAFREIYLVSNFATANVARNLGKGNGSETTFGLKSFLMSNFELETLYISRQLKEQGVDNGYNLIQLQAHVFF